VSKRLSAVKYVPSHYPDSGLTESSIRWLLFNSEENGFGSCVRRVGRKILIDLDAFENWMEHEAMQGGQR